MVSARVRIEDLCWGGGKGGQLDVLIVTTLRKSSSSLGQPMYHRRRSG